MNAPTSFKRVVNGTRYDVTKATLIADNVYWDGHNMERNGTNTFLYRTPRGNYFTVYLTQWQGQSDRLEPVSASQAQELYEGPLSEHYVEFEEAFPDVEVKEA